jgi:hypothetical protein
MTQPWRPSRWTSNPHQVIPVPLANSLRYLRTQRGKIGPALAACRAAGWGVPALSAATGMTPEAVAQQITRARKGGVAVVPWLEIPKPKLMAEQHPLNGVNGGPIRPLPTLAIAHLRALHKMASRVRAQMPANHPARQCAAHLAEDIAGLLKLGYRKGHICRALYITYRAVDQLLERHGLREPAPSALNTRVGYVYPSRTAPPAPAGEHTEKENRRSDQPRDHDRNPDRRGERHAA